MCTCGVRARVCVYASYLKIIFKKMLCGWIRTDDGETKPKGTRICDGEADRLRTLISLGSHILHGSYVLLDVTACTRARVPQCW